MIVGPSGCGKTTLLNAVAGFHSITSGTILLDGVQLCGEGRPQAKPGPDRVVVFQNGALFPWKTILDNLIFGPLMQRKMSKANAIDKARGLLSQAGLNGCEDAYPGQISSGMRRRAEIARALMNDPAVLLFDEPYRALDALTRSVMHDALLRMHDSDPVTILFITHDIEEAVLLGHRVIVMTARPCKPRLVIDVDIPFPRDKSVVTSDRLPDAGPAIARRRPRRGRRFIRGRRKGGCLMAAAAHGRRMGPRRRRDAPRGDGRACRSTALGVLRPGASIARILNSLYRRLAAAVPRRAGMARIARRSRLLAILVP